MTAAHPFTLEHYRVLLQTAKTAGYGFALFDDQPNGRTVYLRHDVDNSIDNALTVARIEAELSIRSSYLFLLRSPNYNLLAGDSIAKIAAIAAMGHAIGLHFSADGPDGTHDGMPTIADRIRADARTMGQAVGLPISLFSFHNPSGRDDFQVDVPGLTNTYAPRFFGEIKYLSESNFRWREGCPCDLLRDGVYPALQILVHPMSYCDDLRTDRDALLYFLYRKVIELRDANQAQTLTLRDHPVTLQEIVTYLRSRDPDASR